MSDDYLIATANYIRRVQQADGAIPWFAGGILDPWDHVEAAMGLAVAGHLDEAAAAYAWLARHQRADGAWYAAYRDGRVLDDTRAETNFVAYVATGVWHQYLINGDRQWLSSQWPTVRAAMAFVAGLQAPTGEIYWALDSRTGINKDALITGCSSIYKSLECAALIAAEVGDDAAPWLAARNALGRALRHRPERFDRTWESKARFAMDWFYPILTGVVTGSAARARLAGRWREFVEPGLGCRCVADQAWVTIAETCELAIACIAAGARQRGRGLLDDVRRFQAEDGSWWTGYAMTDQVLWPDERPTWTAGSVLLAADALLDITPASRLFTQTLLAEPAQHAEGAGGFEGGK